MNYRGTLLYLSGLLVILFLVTLPYLLVDEENHSDPNALRVMTYSSFIQKWGAGPEIAKRFEEETGIKIKWINAGNAGLIIERLRFKKDSDRPDMVIGFDQFSLQEAKQFFRWLDLKEASANLVSDQLPQGLRLYNFLAYDWGPLTFVYRRGEVEPPETLQDLAQPYYAKRLILQDPRMSSPGLQFLLWILFLYGEEEAFSFLETLQPSIKLMAPSWSSSYSLFKVDPGSLVFSYFTSPLYHLIEENNKNYTAVKFSEPHPVQVEYAGVPDFCKRCEEAKKFAAFLLRKDIQKILMEKNYMFPVEGEALKGSQFVVPEGIKYLQPVQSSTFIKNKRELVNRWKKVFY